MTSEHVIDAIDKQMRLLDRKSRKCSKNGDHRWAMIYMGQVLGLLAARNIVLEQTEKDRRSDPQHTKTTGGRETGSHPPIIP